MQPQSIKPNNKTIMKLKLSFALSLIVMAMSSVVANAERVAPTLPVSQTPEMNQCYWIYNVGTGLFLHNATNGYAGLQDTGFDMWLSTCANGVNIRKGSATGDYLYGYDSDIRYNSNNGNWADVWLIAATEGGYTIQRYNQHAKYDENEYVGYTENNKKQISPNSTTDNIVWRFFTPADAAHYIAEVRLYNVLESTNDTEFAEWDWFMDKYETVYTNRASETTEVINNAANCLAYQIEAFNGYQAPTWNEYPIALSTPDGSFGDGNEKTWKLNNPYSSFTRVIKCFSIIAQGLLLGHCINFINTLLFDIFPST